MAVAVPVCSSGSSRSRGSRSNSSIHVYMYTCISAHVHICIYIYIYTYVHTHTLVDCRETSVQPGAPLAECFEVRHGLRHMLSLGVLKMLPARSKVDWNLGLGVLWFRA